MFTVETYINSLKDNLEKNTEKLIQNLKAIINYNYYNEIDLLDFSVFMQPFELSIMMFSMDKEANEVFYQGNDSSIYAGSLKLLGEIEYHQLPDNKSDEFWGFYEQNDEVISTSEEQTIVEWFVACWDKAGGHSFTLPAYLVFHDDVKSFDLHRNKWISDDEKWSD
ncbi:hypothetical protein [Neobacillus sp. DY30]|uniref:hypothetical protein n=1 Tax=Neobacillus sp. DY30 TaxID=3047871 RepID=UPI0024BF386D|nr:hypothetical protein [Neobacillus sp. DY30]WHY01336.1 hypothetical protein QNH29_03535 [Neobacillus sp. DY30]